MMVKRFKSTLQKIKCVQTWIKMKLEISWKLSWVVFKFQTLLQAIRETCSTWNAVSMSSQSCIEIARMLLETTKLPHGGFEIVEPQAPISVALSGKKRVRCAAVLSFLGNPCDSAMLLIARYMKGSQLRISAASNFRCYQRRLQTSSLSTIGTHGRKGAPFETLWRMPAGAC
jgi:hypothetical protein